MHRFAERLAPKASRPLGLFDPPGERAVYETTDSGGVMVLRPVTAYEVDPP
jgi:hypothetical protein